MVIVEVIIGVRPIFKVIVKVIQLPASSSLIPFLVFLLSSITPFPSGFFCFHSSVELLSLGFILLVCIGFSLYAK